MAAAASARREELQAQGQKAFRVLTAFAIVVLAIGAAGWMIVSALPRAEKIAVASPTVVNPVPQPPAPQRPTAASPASTQQEEGVVTTNFSLFRSKEVQLAQRRVEVTAGHHFDHEEDPNFARAWCYTNIRRDGIWIEISLGSKQPGLAPKLHTPTSAELEHSKLTRDEVARLFENCPWLDGNPNANAEENRSASYVFDDDVTKASVDRLVAALQGGVKRIELSSPGGQVSEGARAHAAIREAGADTVATGSCASACTLLFLAGSDRSVASGGAIGVHQWRTNVGVTSDEDAQYTSAMLVDLILGSNVSHAFYVAGAVTPANDMYWLSPSELNDWGVVTATASG